MTASPGAADAGSAGAGSVSGGAPVVPDELLRPAIELAFVALVGASKATPPVPLPPAVAPYARFQKLPGPALAAVRRVVEADDDLRERLATVATEDVVERAGWLWLVRPEGWAAELEAMAAAEAAEEDDKLERRATKRLAAAEEKARKASADAHAARGELVAERRARADAQHRLDKAERRLAQLEIELGGARRRLAEAEARAAEAEARAAEADARAIDAEARAAGALQRVEALETARETAEARARETAEAGARETAEARARETAQASARAAQERAPAAPSAPGPGDDAAGAAAAALREAAAATERLARALAEAGAALAPPPPAPREPVRAAPRPERAAGRGNGRCGDRPARPRRVPLPLPGGVFADSVPAAEHLVRCPGVLLLVDGYNVAKLGWPELALPEQRTRLLDALDELVARFGTQVRVVFDGADVEQLPTGRRRLLVSFSPPGVLADDVIVDLVGSLPAEQPVVVATNDGEVRDGARAAGANVISSQQLLAVARRG